MGAQIRVAPTTCQWPSLRRPSRVCGAQTGCLPEHVRIMNCIVIFCATNRDGCSFFACSSKLPTYSGAFLLTVDNFSFFTYSWSFLAYSFSFLTYSWSFFAYSGKLRLIRALRDCKQRSLTVSKKAPTVSKKASPNRNRRSMHAIAAPEASTKND